jgi:hypothetical protein
MFQDVVDKMRRILGGGHSSTITAMNNLANILRDLNQRDEAIALVRRLYSQDEAHIYRWTPLFGYRYQELE